MMLPATSLSGPDASMKTPEFAALPEMRLPCPSSDPPMSLLNVPLDNSTPSKFPMATLPVVSVPMKFPKTLLLSPSSINTPALRV
jgi:hypothetical protein